MKDDFDKRLKDRITGVFDNYEDTSADAGWALLREKYPEKKKRRGAIWLWMGSAAAILLLFLAIWIQEESNVHPKSNRVAAKISREEKSTLDTSLHAAAKTSTASAQTQAIISVSSQPSVQKISQSTNNLVQKNTVAVKSGYPSQTVTTTQQVTPSQQGLPVINEPTKTSPQQNSGQQAIVANQVTNAGSSADTSARKNIAQNNTQPVKPVAKSPFTEHDPVIKKDKPSDNTKLISFGVYAATYINYASGSNSQVNVGAGFASDIHLAKNLKLSTGVAVNQNSLSFGNGLHSSGRLYAAAPPVNLTAFSTGPSTTVSYSIPVLKSYNAQLTSLDVPLNLKYEFNPKKNSSFISFGLSSGTFINETYSSQYGSSANASTQTQSNNVGSFSSFYFAKTLDFSFGLGYPIGKNNLSIEPFVKYPLQGLGAEQLRFGAGGLNLKFNFRDNKK